MKKLLFMVIFLPMSLFSAPVEFWTCKFADGYDMNEHILGERLWAVSLHMLPGPGTPGRAVELGLGCIVALHHRSSSLH